MKNLCRALLLLLSFPLTSAVGQVVLTRIDGTFSISNWNTLSFPQQFNVPNPDFPNGINGSFSTTLNVPQVGDFFADTVLEQLSITPAAFGSTTLSPLNVGLQVWFANGTLTFGQIGGIVDGVNAWGTTPNATDFILQIELNIGGIFLYQIDGVGGRYYSSQFEATLTQTALPVGAVPEPSTYGTAAGLLALSLVVFRRKFSRTG